MVKSALVVGVAVAMAGWTNPGVAQWLDLQEDPTRLSVAPSLGAEDVAEKDYAWGDVDQDGDVDLVVARKQPWTTTGRRPNVLLMNEAGVLTDRTADYASASDVDGDVGFLTPTNDRDVTLVDVNGDTWLDVVTAVTLTDNAEKHLSHPRVYINLGEDGGLWQGFEHQDARIPQMHDTAGPRFCAVSAGDVTGDGAPDLFFSDYDSGPTQIFDFNDRLLVNDGNGFFTDETTARLTAEMYVSNFGIANAIEDMNDDGVRDIVRLTALGTPYHIGIAYNDPFNEGFFSLYEQAYNLSAYHTAVGDLNQDGRLDIVAVDDGTDRYLLNQGNDPLGRADFSQFVFPPETGVIFAGNVVIDDLDNDTWNDVIIADGDVDIPGCDNQTFLFHNLGNGPDVAFQQQGEVIPADMLAGVHDVAVFDIDDNGWLDLVIGRCTGTQVWMGQPPVGLVFYYLGGLPSYIEPGVERELTVRIVAAQTTQPEPGTGRLHLSINGGPYAVSDMTWDGDTTLYTTTLPAGECLDEYSFYFSAEDELGTTFGDPPLAPAVAYTTTVALGTEIQLRDEMEEVTGLWTVESDPSLTAGAWVQVDPAGTIFSGDTAQPEDDATQGVENVMAFVTGNDASPEPGAADVDGGPTHLISPALDLFETDAIISYARWFFSAGSVGHVPDELTVAVSPDDGGSWVSVPEQTIGGAGGGTGGVWETVSFRVSDYIVPTETVRVRFTASDTPNDSITEAGIDNFQVEWLVCEDQCPGDTNDDGVVNVVDLVAVILDWGTDGSANNADANGDGIVDVLDLLEAILGWGEC